MDIAHQNNVHKMAPDVEHRNHADEKSSDSDVANDLAWTDAEEKAVRNKVSTLVWSRLSYTDGTAQIDWMIVPLVTFLYLVSCQNIICLFRPYLFL